MQDFNFKISVALCTYNGACYLREQLDSILNQTYPASEIVIIDDCSSDETLNIIKEYADREPHIKYEVNAHNLGFIKNFSLAISKTNCDYVALADQDDIWTEDHLELLLNNIHENAVCVGDAKMINEDGEDVGLLYSDIKQNFYIPSDSVLKAYRIVYNYNPYQGASMLIDRGWVENFLPILPDVGYHDTYFALCASLTKGLCVIPDIINYYRIHSGQVTTQWKVTVFDEISHRKYRIYYPSKDYIINSVVAKVNDLSKDALVFIKEFRVVQELDTNNKRLKVLNILNRHYKEIYSCSSHKYIILRSLHFLLFYKCL